MNCDEAFDALTDINNRESDDLERHLNLCPRCRQMREVLEPALTLFDPPVDYAERRSINAGQDVAAESIRKQFLSVEAVQMARETAQRLAAVDRRKKTATRKEVKWLLLQVAAVAASVALIFSLFAPIASGPERGPSATGAVGPMTLSQCLWSERSLVDRSKAESRTVVSKCVACHFDKTFE